MKKPSGLMYVTAVIFALTSGFMLVTFEPPKPEPVANKVIGWRLIKYGTEYQKFSLDEEKYAYSQSIAVGGRLEPIYEVTK